jgi:hypothetical protein
VGEFSLIPGIRLRTRTSSWTVLSAGAALALPLPLVDEPDEEEEEAESLELPLSLSLSELSELSLADESSDDELSPSTSILSSVFSSAADLGLDGLMAALELASESESEDTSYEFALLRLRERRARFGAAPGGAMAVLWRCYGGAGLF